MIDHFKIDSPTVISFSGGRTSAYMLWRVLQSNGGLPDVAKICFANTGKECEETLLFVDRCSKEWGVNIHWIEYDEKNKVREVDFCSASRLGEPFEKIINKRKFLPNPVARFCTVALKIEPEIAFLKSIGWTEWESMVGIRADEQRRAAKIKANRSGGKGGVERTMPLFESGITKTDVGKFWSKSNFDLGLLSVNGVTPKGNCDLCFLKGIGTIKSIIRDEPERANWWAKMEGNICNEKISDGWFFRKDRPSYSQIKDFFANQHEIDIDDAIGCFCGD